MSSALQEDSLPTEATWEAQGTPCNNMQMLMTESKRQNTSATPSVPSQPEGKIGLPRANPRGAIKAIRAERGVPNTEEYELRPRAG